MSQVFRVFIRQYNDFLHVFEYRAMGLDSSVLIFEWPYIRDGFCVRTSVGVYSSGCLFSGK